MNLGFTVLLLPLLAAVLTLFVSKKRAIFSSYISTASALICLLISINFIIAVIMHELQGLHAKLIRGLFYLRLLLGASRPLGG